MHVVRRGHLYLGLFLLPWAILYGITAFLFNHPMAFSDQPTIAFDRSALVDTELAALPNPDAIAAEVVARLNEIKQPSTPYQLGDGPAKFSREFAFATSKTESQTVNVLIDMKAGSGTVRSNMDRKQPEPAKAPFAVGNAAPANRRRQVAARSNRNDPSNGEGVRLKESIVESVQSAVPNILRHTGFPVGDIVVTSVPDIVFPIQVEDRTWTATFSPMTGVVSGRPADEIAESEISVRRFLTRLHVSHGYPSEVGARWFWAVIVDLMAGVMCFWGVSGLFMWWQIKATRRYGMLTVFASAVAAIALGIGMYLVIRG